MRLLKQLQKRLFLDPSAKAFVRFNRGHFPQTDGTDDSIILLDFFFQHVVAYRYSVIANFLKKKTGAKIRHFSFHQGRLGKFLPHLAWEKIYRSFGSRPGLSFKWAKGFEAAADRFAEEVFAGLKEKWDVVKIQIDGITIGDLIYDSYLREGHFTADIRDPRLREIIRDAYLIFRATEKYFTENKVRAFLTGHAVYIQFGIPVRLAAAKGIPIYVARQYDFSIFQLREEVGFQRYSYMRFREMFEALPAERREEGRRRGGELLAGRLAGKIDHGIADMKEKGRPGVSGYAGLMQKRQMKETGRPRILLMLNCFFDAPHTYRWMLFPDFWEWVDFTLQRAAATPFDWYVKPHPGGFPANDLILEEFKKRYPHVTFLGRDASNNQILKEGISAMFTVHGTAGHEFAFAGIPVVNAADNPHISFGFNLHPKNLEEYERAILNADRLGLQIDRAEVEAFAYMHYLHFLDQSDKIKDVAFDRYVQEDLGGDIESPRVYDYFLNSPNEKYLESQAEYLEQFFQPKLQAKSAETL